MQCPKCGYVLTPFEVDCPRCKIFDWFVSVPPAKLENTDDVPASEAAGPVTLPTVPLASELDAEDKKRSPALVPCPLCQHLVSPHALQCPSCGHPMASTATKPEAAKSVSTVLPVTAMKPAAPIASVREVGLPARRPIPVPLPPRPSVSPAVAIPQAAPPRELPLTPAREVRLEPQTFREERTSYKPLAFAAVALAVVALSIWLGLSLSRAGRNHPAEASPLLRQASQLISQADADALQFQQTELTPEQATVSLQTRTTQYQEAQRLCQAAAPSGADQSTRLRNQQAATSGLHQVQADTEAQSARLMTAEIGASIALYKHQTLTDTQAARIRSKLRADCGAALTDCADALKDDPANAVAWASRVRALRFLGEPKAADAALAHALKLSPGSPILLAQGGTPK